MSLNERKQMILALLSKEKDLSMQELGDCLHYSQATLRRDVTALEESGLLRRTHGMIHQVDYVQNIVPSQHDRSLLNLNSKRLIARRATELIKDHSTIILDSGTTTGVLAQELLDRHLNIVTNSLEVSLLLSQSGSQVISCGGLLESRHLCFVGPAAESFLANIEASVLFLGTSGVRGSIGLTTSSPLQYNIKQTMIKAAKRRVVLFDLSKFNAACLFAFSDFSDIETIITLRPESGSENERHLNNIGRRGVEILYADDGYGAIAH